MLARDDRGKTRASGSITGGMCNAAGSISFSAATAIAPGFVVGVDRVGFIVYISEGWEGLVLDASPSARTSTLTELCRCDYLFARDLESGKCLDDTAFELCALCPNCVRNTVKVPEQNETEGIIQLAGRNTTRIHMRVQ